MISQANVLPSKTHQQKKKRDKKRYISCSLNGPLKADLALSPSTPFFPHHFPSVKSNTDHPLPFPWGGPPRSPRELKCGEELSRSPV